jgi:hypothetical protein
MAAQIDGTVQGAFGARVAPMRNSRERAAFLAVAEMTPTATAATSAGRAVQGRLGGPCRMCQDSESRAVAPGVLSRVTWRALFGGFVLSLTACDPGCNPVYPLGSVVPPFGPGPCHPGQVLVDVRCDGYLSAQVCDSDGGQFVSACFGGACCDAGFVPVAIEPWGDASDPFPEGAEEENAALAQCRPGPYGQDNTLCCPGSGDSCPVNPLQPAGSSPHREAGPCYPPLSCQQEDGALTSDASAAMEAPTEGGAVTAAGNAFDGSSPADAFMVADSQPEDGSSEVVVVDTEATSSVSSDASLPSSD